MRLDREINSMRLTSIFVNIDALKKERDKLSFEGRVNLDMLEEDFRKHVKELQNADE
jgi:hypothetical protein